MQIPRTRGELDKARGEALQLRELVDEQRARVAQVEVQVRVEMLAWKKETRPVP